MLVNVVGPFRLSDEGGADITPPGMKERGILALLALSPGQRRSRAWIQGKLWSDRDPDRASGSCRQALSNIRKALGPDSSRLQTDRSAIWLHPALPLPEVPPGIPGDDLLSDLEVDDAEFQDWLRDERQRRATDGGGPAGPAAEGLAAPGRPGQTAPRTTAAVQPLVVVRSTDPGLSEAGAFLFRLIAHGIEGRLTRLGDVAVVTDSSAQAARDLNAGTTGAQAAVEIEVLREAQTWFVLLRVHALPARRCVWTGRLRLPLQMGEIWQAQDLTRFVNQATSALADLLSLNGGAAPFALINRAVRRIYEFDRTGLNQAEVLLDKVQDADASGLAMAWRAFARLTAVLEFRDPMSAHAAEAEALCETALARSGGHPVVLAIAAQVSLKLRGDRDQALYLAGRAVEVEDDNPYALLSLSLASFARGEFEQGAALAQNARDAAEGLPHVTNWEMLCCLSELGLGHFDEALAHARAGQRRMPTYRPALRYLVALNLLSGNVDEALHNAARLTRLEPDFEPRLLLSPDYPVETLRLAGYADGLRPILLG